MSRNVTRRHVVRRSRSRRAGAVLLGAGLLAIAACGDSGGGEGEAGSITYAGFGGTYEDAVREALFDPYSEESDVEVLYDASGSNVAQLVSMSESGNMTIDLVDTEDSTLAQFMAADILQPIDADRFADVDFADPDLITDYSVPWYTFSRNIYWNEDMIPDGLDSWADLFDVEAHPGTRGIVSLPWGTLEGALIADGVSPDELYPLDVDRALEVLDGIRDDTVFFDSNGDLQNAISQGEIAAGYANLARVTSVDESGAVPLGYTWTGAVLSTQQLVVPEGAPNPEAAFDAVEYALRPEVQEAILEDLRYTPSLQSVLDGLDEETLAELPGTEQTASPETFHIDVEWWAENGAEVGTIWEDWLNR